MFIFTSMGKGRPNDACRPSCHMDMSTLESVWPGFATITFAPALCKTSASHALTASEEVASWNRLLAWLAAGRDKADGFVPVLIPARSRRRRVRLELWKALAIAHLMASQSLARATGNAASSEGTTLESPTRITGIPAPTAAPASNNTLGQAGSPEAGSTTRAKSAAFNASKSARAPGSELIHVLDWSTNSSRCRRATVEAASASASEYEMKTDASAGIAGALATQ
jgi:hypothetical protein